MWKYVTRRIRDALEKSVNHFDKRSSTGVVNSAGSTLSEEQNKRIGAPSCWQNPRKCWKSFCNDNDTKSKRWNFDDLNRTWIGAITWSSALVIGWYTSQLIHLKLKYKCRDDKKNCYPVNCLLSSLHPYIDYISKSAVGLNSSRKIEQAIASVPIHVHLLSNENKTEEKASTSGSNSSTSSSDELGEVLNSIENRLGLAAIENGQHQDGLNLLRSAANRNHAPALFNLGLCYEMGMGVAIDEKMAMELYRMAATQQHPGALYNLGIYYGQGRGGLTRDTATAKRLLRLAAVQGQQDAIKALSSLDDAPEPYTDKWENNLYSPDEHFAPTHSVLFVENTSHNYNVLVC
ncbi:Chitin synthase regulatory factor 2 [Papilio machaon]|uniref:Chitin synthase regulatory factor 2 n=1 Tax=Papilio machaon TaxID=76193 RepID=A0A194QZA6_PAPMA|nr:Chitin synthase regulatory factor 2 [Papilio machaon]